MQLNRRTFLAGTAALASTALTRPSFSQEGAIKIGVMAPLSGFQQLIGEQVLAGAEIARDAINGAGGVNGRMIELVVRDERGDANQGSAIAREFAGEGVNLTLGTPLTAVAMAVNALVPSLGGVHLITGSIDPKFSHELFTGHSFTVAQNTIQRMRALAAVMAERYPDITVWGGKMPDIAVTHDSWAIFAPALTAAYKEQGKDITILDPVLSKFGNADFKPQIAQLLGSPIQGLFGMEIGSDGITFYKQAKQMGLWNKVQALAENSLEITLAKTLGVDSPPEMWSPTHWYQEAYPDVAESVHLVSEYNTRKSDPYPGGIVALGDTAIRAYAAAIGSAGSTETPAVIAALETVPFNSVNGPARFRKEDHVILNDMLVLKVAPDDAAPNWKVPEILKLDGLSLLGDPTPGVAFAV